MNVSDVPLVNQPVLLYFPRVSIQADHMFRQAKPLCEERIFMSTGDIEHSFAGEIAEYFIQVGFDKFHG